MNTTKSILITGSSTGIGKSCALHLDQLGYKVFAGVRKESDGDALSAEASDALQPVILDVTKKETIQAAVEVISRESKCPLWGLVNNAGVGISGVLEATPEDELRKLLEVNVIGLHAVTRACLPLLRVQRGRIVNIGSLASFLAGPGASSYAASKFAVRAISDSLRLELQPLGLRVSLVAPGATESDIWDKAKAYKAKLQESVDPELQEAYELFVSASDRIVAAMQPIPAIEVARAVEHAITAKKPRYVYPVGKDAKKACKVSRWPTGLLNWLMLKHIRRLVETTT